MYNDHLVCIQIDTMQSNLNARFARLEQLLTGLLAALVMNQTAQSGAVMPAVAVVAPTMVNGGGPSTHHHR